MAEKEIIVRLNKIEGQIRGLKNMIENQRNCGDILIQISAIQAALKKATELILKDDALKCLGKFSTESAGDNLEELISTVIKFMDVKTDGDDDEQQ